MKRNPTYHPKPFAERVNRREALTMDRPRYDEGKLSFHTCDAVLLGALVVGLGSLTGLSCLYDGQGAALT